MPCDGTFSAANDAEVEALGVCSRITGGLYIEGGVNDLSPFSCLREVEEELVVEMTTLETLDGFSALEHVLFLAVVDNDNLLGVVIESLTEVEGLFLLGNASLDHVGFAPTFSIVEQLEVIGNPSLPDCAVVELAMQGPPTYACMGNLLDMCSMSCG